MEFASNGQTARAEGPKGVLCLLGSRISYCGPALRLAAAITCLLSGWYFAVVIAPAGLGPSAPNPRQGLYAEWLGAREILRHGRSPYQTEITREIQVAVYGNVISGAVVNQQRFAYPVYVVFLFFPVALLPFAAAQHLVLLSSLILTAISSCLWLRCLQFRSSVKLLAVIPLFGTYPVVLGLQLRQPTLLIAGLLALVVYLVRTKRLVWAGIVAALCTAKPQLAIAVLLPLTVWALTAWRSRKRFLLALGAAMFFLLCASEVMQPGWFGLWLQTIRAYSHYAGSTPLLLDAVGPRLIAPAALLLIGAVVWASYSFRESDLLFAISFSIAAFQLVFPFLLYNEVLLLAAVLWLLHNAEVVRARGQLNTLLWNSAAIALASGWAASIGLTAFNLLAPGSTAGLWQLPMVAAWIFPWTVFLVLSAFAVPLQASRARAQDRPWAA